MCKGKTVGIQKTKERFKEFKKPVKMVVPKITTYGSRHDMVGAELHIQGVAKDICKRNLYLCGG